MQNARLKNGTMKPSLLPEDLRRSGFKNMDLHFRVRMC